MWEVRCHNVMWRMYFEVSIVKLAVSSSRPKSTLSWKYDLYAAKYILPNWNWLEAQKESALGKACKVVTLCNWVRQLLSVYIQVFAKLTITCSKSARISFASQMLHFVLIEKSSSPCKRHRCWQLHNEWQQCGIIFPSSLVSWFLLASACTPCTFTITISINCLAK